MEAMSELGFVYFIVLATHQVRLILIVRYQVVVFSEV